MIGRTWNKRSLVVPSWRKFVGVLLFVAVELKQEEKRLLERASQTFAQKKRTSTTFLILYFDVLCSLTPFYAVHCSYFDFLWTPRFQYRNDWFVFRCSFHPLMGGMRIRKQTRVFALLFWILRERDEFQGRWAAFGVLQEASFSVHPMWWLLTTIYVNVLSISYWGALSFVLSFMSAGF